MHQKGKLFIIILAAVLLVGLVVLAASIDNGYQNTSTGSSQGGTGSSESTQETGKNKWAVTYEEYIAMTGAEQKAFYNSFDSKDDYFKWYNAAKKAYDNDENNIIIGGDGSVDLGDILNGNK